MIKKFGLWLVATIHLVGYPGIVILMAVESSFIPFPSEIVVPPAGYQAAMGKMNLWLVIGCGLLGSMIGAYVNYYLAVYAGRPFLVKYGRYFLISESKLDQCDRFFAAHGEITTFVGRLIPGIRQLISFPAGLARMNLLRFSFYTALGAGIWTVILAYLGYWAGLHSEDVDKVYEQYGGKISAALLAAVCAIVAVYVLRHRAKRAAVNGEEKP